MLFSLEALDANNGDCLFLHFGKKSNPKLIIIDGGPAFSGPSTVNTAIKPRLKEMATLLGVSHPLSVKLMMVSHIDDDHIGGVLKLLDNAASSSPLIEVESLWHNSFDDFLGTDELDAIASFGATTGSAAAAFDSHTLSMAAGVKQGLELRDKAKSMALIVNAGTNSGKFVAAGDKFKIGDMKLTVIGPAKNELETLQAKFDAENPNISAMTASQRRNAMAGFTDGSVANLASIVVLVEQNGKTMLLTGDARGDKILEGLTNAGLLSSGKINLDILKVPHHGSDHNVSTEFFRKVRAKHYVFSANGKNDNPDDATLQMLTTARKNQKYTMWFTHKLSSIVDFVKKDRKDNTRKYEVEYRDSGATSLWVDLDEALDF